MGWMTNKPRNTRERVYQIVGLIVLSPVIIVLSPVIIYKGFFKKTAGQDGNRKSITISHAKQRVGWWRSLGKNKHVSPNNILVNSNIESLEVKSSAFDMALEDQISKAKEIVYIWTIDTAMHGLTIYGNWNEDDTVTITCISNYSPKFDSCVERLKDTLARKTPSIKVIANKSI